MAKSVLKSLGNDQQKYQWPEHEWKMFEAVCEEELDPKSIVLKAARAGIICHSNRLTNQVRLAMEVLMRSYRPKIIIATNTLGQGVNIGITSVIINSPYIGKNERINKADFWNICGRAGRAFVDHEGKILYTIDTTRNAREIKKDEKIAEDFFKTISDPVISGLLGMVNFLQNIAITAGIPFDRLIELVANNNLQEIVTRCPEFESKLDLIDDGLLALNEDPSINDLADDSIGWIDDVFCQSLAAIQARTNRSQSTSDNVITFLKARMKSILIRVPNKGIRKSLVASGLPLSVAIKAYDSLNLFRTMVDEYLQSNASFASLNTIVQKIEVWTRENGFSITKKMPEEQALNNLRELWLDGVALRKIVEIESGAATICKDFYGYQLPWIINAISQKFDKEIEKERVDALSQVALLIEIGVPTELAARIFLAGIHSRVVATELSSIDFPFGSSITLIRRNLLNSENELISRVSPGAVKWLNFLTSNNSDQKISIPKFAPFRLKNKINENKLYVRKFEGNEYLCSLDGRVKILAKSSIELPFSDVADNLKFVFEQTESTEIWRLTNRDPHCEN